MVRQQIDNILDLRGSEGDLIEALKELNSGERALIRTYDTKSNINMPANLFKQVAREITESGVSNYFVQFELRDRIVDVYIGRLENGQ